MVYEGLLLTGVLFATALPFGVLTHTHNALDNRHALQAVLFLVIGLYFIWFWSKGQTLAMKTWHLHLQQGSGQLPTRTRAAVRYLLCWVWVLPPAILAWALSFTPSALGLSWAVWFVAWYGLAQLRTDKQCWHDVACGTRLVYIAPAQSPSSSKPKTARR